MRGSLPKATLQKGEKKKKISKEHCVIAAKSEPVPTRETDLRLKMIEVKEQGQERRRRGEGEMRSRQTNKPKKNSLGGRGFRETTDHEAGMR